jgi:hypothetical protein
MITKIILHNTSDGSFPSVDTVWERFRESAVAAGVPFDVASRVFEDGCGGDTAARELIESTCNVEFSMTFDYLSIIPAGRQQSAGLWGLAVADAIGREFIDSASDDERLTARIAWARRERMFEQSLGRDLI